MANCVWSFMARLDLANLLPSTSLCHSRVTSCYRLGVGPPWSSWVTFVNSMHLYLSICLFSAYRWHLQPSVGCCCLPEPPPVYVENIVWHETWLTAVGEEKTSIFALRQVKLQDVIYAPELPMGQAESGTFMCSHINHILVCLLPFSILLPPYLLASIFSSIFSTNQLHPREARTGEHLLSLIAPYLPNFFFGRLRSRLLFVKKPPQLISITEWLCWHVCFPSLDWLSCRQELSHIHLCIPGAHAAQQQAYSGHTVPKLCIPSWGSAARVAWGTVQGIFVLCHLPDVERAELSNETAGERCWTLSAVLRTVFPTLDFAWTVKSFLAPQALQLPNYTLYCFAIKQYCN